jgi:hypothetical protein
MAPLSVREVVRNLSLCGRESIVAVGEELGRWILSGLVVRKNRWHLPCFGSTRGLQKAICEHKTDYY